MGNTHLQQETNSTSLLPVSVNSLWTTKDSSGPSAPDESEADTGSASLSEQDEQLTFGKAYTLEHTSEGYTCKVCGLWELKRLPKKGKLSML